MGRALVCYLASPLLSPAGSPPLSWPSLFPVILSRTGYPWHTPGKLLVQYLIVHYSTVLHQLVQYLYSALLHPPLESPGLYYYTPPGEYLVEPLMCKYDSLYP